MEEWLHPPGLDAPSAVAGFSGGIVRVIFDHTTKPLEAVGALIAGALVANYLGGPIAEALHLPPHGTEFLVGFGALQLMKEALSWLRTKIGVTQSQSTTTPEQKGPTNVS
jgi:hypothetical protein